MTTSARVLERQRKTQARLAEVEALLDQEQPVELIAEALGLSVVGAQRLVERVDRRREQSPVEAQPADRIRFDRFEWLLEDKWLDAMTPGRVFKAEIVLRADGTITNAKGTTSWLVDVLEVRRLPDRP